MVNYFSAGEIVQLAIQVEVNGKHFYAALAKQAADKKVKGMFEFLSKQEDKHIETFQGILSAVGDYKPPVLLTEEYYLYMNAMASEHIFTQQDRGESAAKGAKTVCEALDLALTFEKQSVEFYGGLRKLVPEHEQQVVDRVVAEELNHVRLLTDFKKEI